MKSNPSNTLLGHYQNRKPHAVKPRQTVKSRQPQITVAGLNYSINRILRQPVVHRPRIKPILRLRRDKRKAETKTQE